MTEEGQAEASETTETTEAPQGTQKETTGFVNADGSLVEGWQTRLSDSTLHEDKTLASFKTFEALAKSMVHVRRQVPMDKIAVPGKNSTDAEWDEWYKAGGRPETPQDYNLNIPDDAPEGMYTKKGLAEWQELFHKLGLSKKQAKVLFETDKAKALAVLQTRQQAEELAQSEAKNKLFQLWGNAYEQRIHFGNAAVEKGTGGNEEFRTRLCEKYGNDPDFIEFTSNLGAQFVERGSIAAANIPTPGDIDRQIQEEMHQDSYTNRNHPGHKQQVDYVAKLFRDRAASTKTG
jgi:hypothetical protein